MSLFYVLVVDSTYVFVLVSVITRAQVVNTPSC